MSRLLVTYPDIERDTVAALADALSGGFSGGFDPGFDVSTVTVAIGLTVGFDDAGKGTGWTRDMGPHIQVALDGTPVDNHPVAQRSTLRVTVWSRKVTEAKTIAQLAHGHLLADGRYLPGIGLFVAHDREHDAELASFTVRSNVRSVPIP